ncbi:hypothetical protein TSUD_207910 [Trifolium subterraneum]|uniref:PPM-type phosphatase domain-containing protein n=1 Tax=Trifolium subterraneum TaxID=3900 RepID=A0A2Z6P0M7_TRISU|nr:hypothetical protein TSUD_207910 [Trifolium subterraneum]
MLPRICMKKPHVLENDDTTAWFTALERHHKGKFSMAAYQANAVMDDYSQVEVDGNSLFVGIYDGHNGTNAAKFTSNYIFQELSRLIGENNNMMNGRLLREAVAATKEKFTHVVIALIWKETLYMANLGDSRVVFGIIDVDPPLMHALPGEAERLTRDHDCEDSCNRVTLLQQFPYDHTLLCKVRGYSKFHRSIVPYSKFHRSIVSSGLNIGSRILRYGYKFFILASHGFWEIMTNEEAVSIVARHSRRGIAKTLLRKALEKVAAKEKMSYKDIVLSLDRKKYHDDITIIVVFLDLGKDKPLWKRNVPKLSYKSPSHA